MSSPLELKVIWSEGFHESDMTTVNKTGSLLLAGKYKWACLCMD